MLSQVDKECIQSILRLTFCDHRFLNLEFIYSNVEELFRRVGYQKYLKVFLDIKSEFEPLEDDEDKEDEDDEDEEEAEEFECAMIDLLMGKISIQRDLGDEKEGVRSKIYEWIESRESEQMQRKLHECK